MIRRLFHPSSLRLQLLSRSLIILAGILIIVGVSQYVFMQQFLYKNKAESISNQISMIPGGVWEMFEGISRRNGDFPLLVFPDSSVAFIHSNGTFQVLSKHPLSGTVPEFSREQYAQALQRSHKDEPHYTIVKDDLGQLQLAVLEPVHARGRLIGVAQVTTMTEPLRGELLRQLTIFLSLSCAALLFGLLTFMPIIRRTLVPLSRMVSTVARINAGNLNERLPIQQGQVEIDRLSISFNRMLERLESSFDAEKEAKEQMRRFVADASHELRTPLTSIHGFLEVLLRGAASNPEQLEKALKSMYSESRRLNTLVRDLLLLARLDRTPEAQLAEGSLSDILLEMEPQLRLLAGERSVSFHLETQRRSLFDSDKLKQVILNLFQNAVQHTDPLQGTIDIGLREQSGGIELTVRDNGSGIEEEHLHRLFERFYRIDTSRARIHGGAGLGLAISKSIIDLHKGFIRAESVPGEGSTFRFWIPA